MRKQVKYKIEKAAERVLGAIARFIGKAQVLLKIPKRRDDKVYLLLFWIIWLTFGYFVSKNIFGVY